MEGCIKGCVHIFTNPSFKGLVKIWYADHWEKRLKQLNSSETVPYAFRAYAYYETISRLTDIEVHALIDNMNPDFRTIENFHGKKRVREFNAMSPEDAYGILENASRRYLAPFIASIKPKRPRKRRGKVSSWKRLFKRRGDFFTFSGAHVPIGAEVVFTRDPSIVAAVIDDRHIRY